MDDTKLAIEVHALSPDRMPDFLRFFDEDAFSDNPRWASCYCQCFYEDHATVVWKDRTADENRALACERGARGTMQGWLAYLEGRVVGWCNAVPRTRLAALDDEPTRDDDADGRAVGAMPCFLVRPDSRRRGIARALLDAACDGFAAQGLTIAEAYPRVATDDPAANHFGPLRMFLAAGFTIDHEDASDGSVVVRKRLDVA